MWDLPILIHKESKRIYLNYIASELKKTYKNVMLLFLSHI